MMPFPGGSGAIGRREYENADTQNNLDVDG